MKKSIFLTGLLTAVLGISGHVFAALDGSGIETAPYLIQSQADFAEFADPDNAAIYWASSVHTRLMCDIDFADQNLAPVAPDTNPAWGFQGTPFRGLFDGNHKVLSNFVIDLPGCDYVGLFGFIVDGGVVKDLNLASFSVTGRNFVGGLCGYNDDGAINRCSADGTVEGSDYVGGVCGINDGVISRCYSTGSASGSGYVGSLCGQNDTEGVISLCYAAGSVTSPYGNDIGGLCGENYGAISRSYATGAVVGDVLVGGFCGHNFGYGTISRCYSVGAVTGVGVGGFCGVNEGGITDSFWDMQTSGQVESSGGTGRTTAQLKVMQTFTDAGWDFLGEDINGTNDSWRLCVAGVYYPRLRWEFSKTADLVCPDGVDLGDLAYFVEQWLRDDCESGNNYCDWADIDADGMVCLFDLVVFADNWLTALSP